MGRGAEGVKTGKIAIKRSFFDQIWSNFCCARTLATPEWCGTHKSWYYWGLEWKKLDPVKVGKTPFLNFPPSLHPPGWTLPPETIVMRYYHHGLSYGPTITLFWDLSLWSLYCEISVFLRKWLLTIQQHLKTMDLLPFDESFLKSGQNLVNCVNWP